MVDNEKWRCRDCAKRRSRCRCYYLLPEDENACNEYVRKRWRFWAAKLLLITLALLLGGCGSWEACKTVEYFELSKTNPTKMVMVRRVITKAKQAQYLTDSSRINIKIDMPDLGKVSIGSSLIDAEDVAPIVGVIVEGVVKGLKL